MTPEEMNDIADAIMIGLKNRFPGGINLQNVSLVMASLSVKLLEQCDIEQTQAKDIITGFIEQINTADITPVYIN